MPVTEITDLDTLAKQLQDLCIQSENKIDNEKVKVEKKILNLNKSKELQIGERVRMD